MFSLLLPNLTPQDRETIAVIQAQTGLVPAQLAALTLAGTCAYFRLHGTLTFLTAETRDCHGCNLLKAHVAQLKNDEAPNIIPGPWADPA